MEKVYVVFCSWNDGCEFDHLHDIITCISFDTAVYKANKYMEDALSEFKRVYGDDEISMTSTTFDNAFVGEITACGYSDYLEVRVIEKEIEY